MKKFMKKGGIIQSKRGDIAYFSEEDNEFLMRFSIGNIYDNSPVVFDFKYIDTFKKNKVLPGSLKFKKNSLISITIETRNPKKWIILDSETNEAFDYDMNSVDKKILKKALKAKLKQLG